MSQDRLSSDTPLLFQPISINRLTLANRITVAPMCQYSAIDGCAGDWHRMHLGMLGSNGAGLVMIEATAVTKDGRISPGCLGIWGDDQHRALTATIEATRTFSTGALGIQLSHAGRKGSTQAPFHGGARLSDAQGGWDTLAPSAIASRPSDTVLPVAMTADDIADVRNAFVQAAHRAVAAGIDLIEIHMAHGYLLHQFLSPLANQRQDNYGGSLENRMRFPLEVFDAVRQALPTDFPLGVRVSATDWVDGGWNEDETEALCQRLQSIGCDFFDISSGGLSAAQKIAVRPGYQVPFAARIKKAVTAPVIVVGMITEPDQAEQILKEGSADMIALARQMLFEPHWAWRAAQVLNGKLQIPQQYLRSLPASPDIALA
ncbi:NADH:flavin oxidoreductase/NADH oxidase [Bordetella tumulicola]|uniref:NADH:flavin oxidoreductase/NADH oxidase n=1 Tax=Bordetella tumulicola TaxID=1649133 RepID=UPI0039EF39D1